MGKSRVTAASIRTTQAELFRHEEPKPVPVRRIDPDTGEIGEDQKPQPAKQPRHEELEIF